MDIAMLLYSKSSNYESCIAWIIDSMLITKKFTNMYSWTGREAGTEANDVVNDGKDIWTKEDLRMKILG